MECETPVQRGIDEPTLGTVFNIDQSLVAVEK
jgi:hypothetical protein